MRAGGRHGAVRVRPDCEEPRGPDLPALGSTWSGLWSEGVGETGGGVKGGGSGDQ